VTRLNSAQTLHLSRPNLRTQFLPPFPLISRLRDVDSEEKGQTDGE
jgi:hypothetical protein